MYLPNFFVFSFTVWLDCLSILYINQKRLYLFQYCIPVLGSAATSKRFDNMNNNDRFKFFLRSVPCDMCQVNATLHLLERMNWRQIAIVHETSVYAQDFYNEFSKLVDKLPTDKKICIVGDQEVEYNDPNNWNDTLNKLEESGARVILLFMDFPQAKQFFDAAACRSTWLNGNYQFVGIDAWSNQLDFSHNSKSLIVNSITSEPSSPILEEFRKYIIGLTLEEVRRREKPDFCPEIDKYTPIADTIMAHNHCDNSSCTGNETLGEVAEGTLIKASFEFDNVYVIAKALANFCNGSSSCKDKLAELNGTHFYDMMKTIEITDLPDYYFKFWNNSNSGIPSYNFYQYQKTNHSEYAWKLVGNYSDSVEDEYKVFIFDGSIVNKIGSIECPKVCN